MRGLFLVFPMSLSGCRLQRRDGRDWVQPRRANTQHAPGQLGAFNSKIEIEEAIKKKAKEVVTSHKALHQDYDRRTNHGKSQGARFP